MKNPRSKSQMRPAVVRRRRLSVPDESEEEEVKKGPRVLKFKIGDMQAPNEPQLMNKKFNIDREMNQWLNDRPLQR